jgi:hypothetical protein
MFILYVLQIMCNYCMVLLQDEIPSSTPPSPRVQDQVYAYITWVILFGELFLLMTQLHIDTGLRQVLVFLFCFGCFGILLGTCFLQLDLRQTLFTSISQSS